MPNFDYLDPLNYCVPEDEPTSTAYNVLILLTGFTVMIYALARFAESNNRLDYENRFARIIGGFLMFMTRMLHTTSGDLKEIPDAKNTLLAIGPHRTGWEALVVASKMKGTPPRFFATDSFSAVPGMSSFLSMFKAIPVKANAAKGSDGRSSNASALEQASQALNEGGCVALFPQGNFAKLHQDPPRVYTGAAQIALKNKVPIHVIRLDGFWCLQNSLIPMFIRNNVYYRALFSGLHMNNVRTTYCCIIDFHLKPENINLSDEEKIKEICAQLYAYYRNTTELTPKQIAGIQTQISKGTHLLIWDNKLKQDNLGKELGILKKESVALETTASMSL